MKKELIEAIIGYVDAKIEYELASREEGEDNHRKSCTNERKVVEKASKQLKRV